MPTYLVRYRYKVVCVGTCDRVEAGSLPEAREIVKREYARMCTVFPGQSVLESLEFIDREGKVVDP